MLQSWVPYMPAYFSFNGVSWFLTLMVFFYAIYPFMVRKIKSLKGEWIAMVSFGIVFIYIALFGLIPENWQHPLLYISPIFRLADFILGMALYSAYKFISVELSDKLEVLSFTRKSAIEVGIVLLLAIMVAMDLCGFVNKGIFMASYFWLPMSSIILIFALFNKSGGG
jgi:peptidoglycan/LPS O-acetylase OafA/YrhL